MANIFVKLHMLFTRNRTRQSLPSVHQSPLLQVSIQCHTAHNMQKLPRVHFFAHRGPCSLIASAQLGHITGANEHLMLNGVRFDLFRSPPKLIKKGDSLERNITGVYGLESKAVHMDIHNNGKQYQNNNTEPVIAHASNRVNCEMNTNGGSQ